MSALDSDFSKAATAWEQYAQGRKPRRQVNAHGARTWLNWTQYPDHGPDESVLGEVTGRVVLELGTGSGCNLAHLATLGATCVGVDLAPSQRAKAEARWGQLPALTFHTADAAAFLADHPGPFDAVFSIFGAMWFTDPSRLLPLIRQRLTPGGVLAFSHLPPDTGRPGPGPRATPAAVKRWDYSGEHWRQLLVDTGFVGVAARVIPPPAGKEPGTLLVSACAARD